METPRSSDPPEGPSGRSGRRVWLPGVPVATKPPTRWSVAKVWAGLIAGLLAIGIGGLAIVALLVEMLLPPPQARARGSADVGTEIARRADPVPAGARTLLGYAALILPVGVLTGALGMALTAPPRDRSRRLPPGLFRGRWLAGVGLVVCVVLINAFLLRASFRFATHDPTTTSAPQIP